MGDILAFISSIFGSGSLEILAVCLGLINITLLIRRSIWNFPFGIVMVIIYSKIFFDYKLYSDSMLQVYFLTVQCYGWWYWLKNQDGVGHVVIRVMSRQQHYVYFIVSVVLALSLGFTMSNLTDADYPFWDATIAALSVVAQFLLSRRYLENWIIWIIVDMLAISLFMIKGLTPTAVLYCIFLVMAYVGWRKWRSAQTRAEPSGEIV